MHTRVEFKSAAFPKYADEDAETVNPGRWGKRLAEFVRDNLPKHGVGTTDILCEDWGWLVNTDHKDFPVWIGCGPLDEVVDTENGPDIQPGQSPDGLIEFAIFVTAEPGFFQRVFKRVDTAPAVQRTVDALKSLIESTPEIIEPTWD
ncbi:hypothetical protein [Prosthecobacter sp.]|uniref:hypothetical protein n=1 Tax=Prosthecobacter sp. TaxID=1965333 RepID=UPI001DF2C0EE|nr:hypothetical protein [Prosthecobacter sp.]MCB1275267.1 hypothetical protein [Prosthecobacter sp.]